MKQLLIVLCVVLNLPVAAWGATADGVGQADQAEAVRGNNAFAVDLYRQLKKQPGNLFFSPESISIALAMIYAGARGETAEEMAKVLHFTLPPEQLHPAMAALLHDFDVPHDGYTLRVADALWGQRGYAFLPDFLALAKEDYSAGFNQVDFNGSSDAAPQTINQWVEQRTEDKIKNLIQPGVLTPLTRLVLTNAIYFKGDWQMQFRKEDTKEEDFHVSTAQIVKAPMMHRTGDFNYLDGGTFQALEIPYKHKDLSMIIFLPKSMDGLAVFEQSLTADTMQQWLGQLQAIPKVIVILPKLKMENQFALDDTLAAMGMKQAFDRKMADFSRMAPKEEMLKDGNLYISAVFHKAFVDVNEEGTEASAATGLFAVEAACAGCGPPPPPIFRADHPFLFLIRDNKSSSILFMGRVIDPSK